MYKIYKIINKVNGKVYIGQTKQHLKQRFREHVSKSSSAIYADIQRYGQNNFEMTVIDEAETKQMASLKEKEWTLFYRSNEPERGYNIAIVSTRTGKTNGFYGKHHTRETISQNKLNQPSRLTIVRCDTGERFQSLREAERITGMSRINIKRICDGKIKNPSICFKYCA